MNMDFWPNVVRFSQGAVVLSVIYVVILTVAAWLGRRV